MLEHLSFELEELGLKVEIVVRERQLHYKVNDGESAVLDGGRRWLRRLEKLHLGGWRASYQPPVPPAVHSLWHLSFRDSKIGSRRIVGDNAYPGSWAALVDLMNEIPGVEISRIKQLEQVAIILHDTLDNPRGSIYLPKQKKISLVEKLIINRGKHLLVFTRHKQGLGSERHAFDSVRNVPLLLERIAEHAAEWQCQQDSIIDDYLPRVEWKLLWRDGTEDTGSYTLRGDAMPEAWKTFMEEIGRFTGNMRGRMF